MARKRHVFPTDEVPHLWAHQTQDEARNPGGNLFFKGDTIYSYGEHFPIARLVTSKVTGARGVLVNEARYSVTTSKHQSMVRRAVPNSFEEFSVPDVFAGIPKKAWDRREGHKGNLAYYKQEAEQRNAQALRAVHSDSIEWKAKDAQTYVTEATRYAQFFGLKTPKINQPVQEIENRLAYIREREAIRETPEYIEKREQALQRKHAGLLEQYRKSIEEFRASLTEKIAQWRAGESVNFYAQYPAFYYQQSRAVRRFLNSQIALDTRPVPTMLRVSKDGQDVETSLGARVPVSHAVRGLRFVRSVVQSGNEYVRNGHTLHLGHYAIDRIEVNGTLHAGCHVISFEEIERLAPSLESLPVSEVSETPETV